jgi:ATP-dependent Clp protease ATP-binding subunit ClpA
VALDELKLSTVRKLKLTERCWKAARISPARRDSALQQAERHAAQQPAALLDVDVRTVATVIADWTGVPLLADER